MLETAFGWQSIFLFVAAASLMVLAWAAAVLPETRLRHADNPPGFLTGIAALARSPSFHGYVLCAAFASGTFFAFLGGGPHAVVTIMGRSPAEFGVWFAVSSVGYMAGNFLTSRLSMLHGIDKMIWWGLVIQIVGVAGGTALAAFAPAGGPAHPGRGIPGGRQRPPGIEAGHETSGTATTLAHAAPHPFDAGLGTRRDLAAGVLLGRENEHCKLNLSEI